MRANLILLCLILLTLFSLGCSKPEGKTSAKVKLSLAKIINFSSGAGSGGAILFGRSSTGELFGKV